MFSDQDTIEDDVAARRVRDMVARSQESALALSEVRHSTDHLYFCLPFFFFMSVCYPVLSCSRKFSEMHKILYFEPLWLLLFFIVFQL